MNDIETEIKLHSYWLAVLLSAEFEQPYMKALRQFLKTEKQLGNVIFPPSLLNIFKEIHQDLAIAMPDHGCLQSWADQDVLLLNATLTVEQNQAGSHQGRGWDNLLIAPFNC